MSGSTLVQSKDHSATLVHSLLVACERVDVAETKKIIRKADLATLSLQANDGWTALHHAAISGNQELVGILLAHGALWSMADHLGQTPGDLAFSCNDPGVYALILNEGLRSELLRLALDSNLKSATSLGHGSDVQEDQPRSSASDNATFLASKLHYRMSSTGEAQCVDSEGNAVMLGWETPIMKETAHQLCATRSEQDLSVLNIGFGLGIIDSFLQNYHPRRHVIVEPHPDVLQFMKQQGWYDKPGVEIYPSRWQFFLGEVQAGNIEANFDAVYWDTFSEEYRDLKQVFECLYDLLSGPQARFSWFHGLGATSQTLYDIYTQIADMDLHEAGLKTTWHEVRDLDRGDETWEGIKRRYWKIPSPYRLPICSFDV